MTKKYYTIVERNKIGQNAGSVVFGLFLGHEFICRTKS